MTFPLVGKNLVDSSEGKVNITTVWILHLVNEYLTPKKIRYVGTRKAPKIILSRYIDKDIYLHLHIQRDTVFLRVHIHRISMGIFLTHPHITKGHLSLTHGILCEFTRFTPEMTWITSSTSSPVTLYSLSTIMKEFITRNNSDLSSPFDLEYKLCCCLLAKPQSYYCFLLKYSYYSL